MYSAEEKNTIQDQHEYSMHISLGDFGLECLRSRHIKS